MADQHPYRKRGKEVDNPGGCNARLRLGVTRLRKLERNKPKIRTGKSFETGHSTKPNKRKQSCLHPDGPATSSTEWINRERLQQREGVLLFYKNGLCWFSKAQPWRERTRKTVLGGSPLNPAAADNCIPNMGIITLSGNSAET